MLLGREIEQGNEESSLLCEFFCGGSTDATAGACNDCNTTHVKDWVGGLVKRGVRSIFELVCDSEGVGASGGQPRRRCTPGSERHVSC